MSSEARNSTLPRKEGTEGFLEQLYLNRFERSRFDGLPSSLPEPRAMDLISRYRKIIQDYPPAVLEKGGQIPEKLMEELKKLGIFGLNIPEEYGGLGFGLTGYLSVLRAMAGTDMALALTPTAHLSIGIKGILLFGDKDQKRSYLTRAATGEMIFAYALTEPETGSDAQHIQTTAVLSDDGSHYILNGHKTYITNGGFAGGLTVFARMDPDRPGFLGAFIVEKAWEGVEVGPELAKMGLKISSTTPISFKDVRVPLRNLLGEPGEGFRIAMTILNYGRLGLGAASTGAMEQSLEDMFKRASSRKQFGVPIREFDLIQEKMVRARVHLFAASSMTAITADLLEEDPVGPMAAESSHVKLYGTTRAWETLYEALQTAGGSGYLAAAPYEKRMRDFRVTTVFEGTSEIHSLYPALYLMRKLGKRLEGMGNAARFLTLIKGAYASPALNPDFPDPIMKRAGKTVKRLTRSVRKLVHLGLLKYGKGVIRREFLQRRITFLSMANFSLLACLASVEGARKAGEDISSRLHLLEYLTLEARQILKNQGRMEDSELERTHRKVFSDILTERESPDREGKGGIQDE